MVNRYSYDPYGKTLSATEGVSNPFRYIGAIWDGSTGLYKMGERYYDPSVARFTQEDPLGGGLGYPGGDPVNFVDPSGLAASGPVERYGGSGGRGGGSIGSRPSPIKPGSRGGPGEGKPFSRATKVQAKTENKAGRCVYCRMKYGGKGQVDHATPKNEGGNNSIKNAQLTCQHCSASKQDNDFPKTPPAGYRGPWPPRWW